MARLILLVLTLSVAVLAPAADGSRYIVDNDLLHRIPHAEIVHDYGPSSLVVVRSNALPNRLGSRLHRISPADSVGFRSWRAAVSATADPRVGDDALVVLALVGPVDSRWLQALEAAKVEILAPAHPFGLVVRANDKAIAAALRLTTSEGARVVRGVVPLPWNARVSRDLAALIDSAKGSFPVTVRVSGFEPRALPAKRLTLAPAAVVGLLTDDPGIALVEPEYPITLHNNLAAQDPLIAVEPVWNELGFNGRDIVIGHNDTGVDLRHPDLPAAAIIATSGSMLYTDTGHGTHTAASLAGRGVVAAPVNDQACGDQLNGLGDLRGMAWGAELVVNNIIEGGLSEVSAMMQWAAGYGATVSSNSWGHGSPTNPVTSYSLSSAEADRAVRDADPDAPSDQSMTIVISAGNSGPTPSSVSAPATAKNVITVGASENLRCGSWVPGHQDGPDADQVLSSSSRGPSQGRIKPDLVAPGSDVLSAQSSDVEATAPWDQAWTGDQLALGTGTSMACPLAAGAAAVFSEARWRSSGVMPSPALVKAALINGATDLGLDRSTQGWGRLNLAASLNGPTGGSVHFLDQDELPQLATGDRWERSFELRSDAAALRLSLAWTDVPGEADATDPLVNDLDLVAIAPDGTVYRGNRFAGRWSAPDPGDEGDRSNPVENVFIALPVAGTWRIEVVAVQVAATPPGHTGQDFALVVSGDITLCDAPPPPSNLSADAVAVNTVELRWAGNADASEFRISRATTSGGRPYTPLATIAAPADSWRDLSVEGGIEYFYAVQQRVGDCWSATSAEASAVATGSCELAPAFAGLSTADDRESVGCSIELGWQPATALCGGPVSYQVYRADSPELVGGPDTLIADHVTGTSFVDHALEHGRAWSYLVRAVDDANGVADDNTAVATAAASGPDRLWFADDGDAGAAQWQRGPASPADSGLSSWELTGTEPLSPENAWFCADAADVTDRALAFATPLELPPQPPLTLEFWHRHVLQERWDGARLEYSVDGGRSWQDILDGDGFAIPANAERFIVGGYEETLARSDSANPLAGEAGWTGRSKGWLPVAVDLTDFAGWPILLRWRLGCDASIDVSGGWWLDDLRIVDHTRCQACDPPPAPTQVHAAATDSGVQISWSAVTGATGYQLARGDVGGPYLAIADVGAAPTAYLDVTASGGSSYGYVVRSRQQCLSDDSPEASALAVGPCTAAPEFWGLERVAAIAGRECALELQWQEAVAGCAGAELGYRVYRQVLGTAEAEPSDLLVTLADQLEYHDYDIADGVATSYLVRAVDLANGREDRNQRALAAVAGGLVGIVLDDDVENDGSGWLQLTASEADRDGEAWTMSGDSSHSPTSSWFVSDQPLVKDQALVLAAAVSIPDTAAPELEFWHIFDLELLWDGGRLEYSVDGEQWFDILAGNGAGIAANPNRFISGAYSATLQVGQGTNPLAGQEAWSGWVDHWLPVRVDLGDFRGRAIWLRWRLATDDSRARVGWWIDDISVSYTTPCGTRVDHPPRRSSGRRP